MSIAELFEEFIDNLALDNGETISLRYGEITAALNSKFRSTDSKTSNNLQVGSYGRFTAIKGISDLDMLYIMPSRAWDDYKTGGQYSLLRDAADAIEARYPKTAVKVDRLVVRVLYENFHVEVQPVFECDDGSFLYPDSYDEGSWKVTKPREELAAMSAVDTQKNQNLRRLCKMARAWKNKHGVGMGGLLIDTLAHNFLQSTSDYDDTSFLRCGLMSRDFFAYLADLPRQDYWAALGSGQRVRVKKTFQGKAAKARDLCIKAIEVEGTPAQNLRWKKVYGRRFPSSMTDLAKAGSIGLDAASESTEEFFEDRFPVDVRYNIRLDCAVTKPGFRPFFLRDWLPNRRRLQHSRSLRFFVAEHDIPEPFRLYWKVLNRGTEAIRRNCIRGQIIEDAGKLEQKEHTNFYGDHVVDCAAVKNGVVVATDRIRVPIGDDDGQE